jgi:transposase InsO family protein
MSGFALLAGGADMVLMLLCWIADWVRAWFRRECRRRHGSRGRALRLAIRSQPKPAWVVREVIRLKALMPDAGCRTIAHVFNRRYAASRKTTVGKTFVADTMRRHRYEIEVMRRKLKHRVPPALPRNLVWAMDLTGKGDAAGNMHMIFGLVDHGSRALLSLAALPNKCSWTLLGYLFLSIGKYGKPRAVRTDNEACFTSRVFCSVLMLSGIRHQRSDPHCPWQNGRIERLFGTLKQKLDQWEVAGFEALKGSLAEFRFFYNFVRPHQHLQGRTPHEAWRGVDPFARKARLRWWFEAWDGLLQGEYLLL